MFTFYTEKKDYTITVHRTPQNYLVGKKENGDALLHAESR